MATISPASLLIKCKAVKSLVTVYDMISGNLDLRDDAVMPTQ